MVQDRVKAIALASDCFQPLSVLAKLFAQTANMGVHCPGNHRILISLNITEQNLSRLSASATLYQAGKQPKLDLRQIESAPFESNFEFALINLKSIHFQNFIAGAGVLSQQGPDTQNELA